MKEDFLHFLWRFKKFNFQNLQTTHAESIAVIAFGSYNTLSGPDFSNATINIGKQCWVGNVEMHLKSSDWFLHGHEKDEAYNNVILHVVWEDDVQVFNTHNQPIPTLVLQPYVAKDVLNQYQQLLFHKYSFINCERSIAEIDPFIFTTWKERLFIERLEEKAMFIQQLLNATQNNWEAVLFWMLMKSFGGNINGESFLSIAQSIDFSVIQKSTHSLVQLESLLFGQARLLVSEIPSAYEVELQKEYQYLVAKFQLSQTGVLPPQFFKLRPPNFPTIRLSQLANLYATHVQLFSSLMAVSSRAQLQEILKVSASEFWKTHYTFQKESKKVPKQLSNSFIDLIIINTVIPLRFCYQRFKGSVQTESLLQLATQIPSEKNTVIGKFDNLTILSNSAKDSQSLLQLYKKYCSKNKCLQCVVGTKLMKP